MGYDSVFCIVSVFFILVVLSQSAILMQSRHLLVQIDVFTGNKIYTRVSQVELYFYHNFNSCRGFYNSICEKWCDIFTINYTTCNSTASTFQ